MLKVTTSAVIVLLVVFLISLAGCSDAPKSPTKTDNDKQVVNTSPANDTDGAATDTQPVKVTKYACPMHPEQNSTNPDDTCEICGMKFQLVEDSAELTKIYGCPMHPEQHSTNPEDTCEICGMKFQLVEDDDSLSEEEVVDPHAGHGH